MVCLTTFPIVQIPTDDCQADLGTIKSKYLDKNRRGLFKLPLQNLPRERENPRRRQSGVHHAMGFRISIPGISLNQKVVCSKRDVHTHTQAESKTNSYAAQGSLLTVAFLSEGNAALGKHNEHVPSN